MTDTDITGWLDILHVAEDAHDIDGITEAHAELDRLLRLPVSAE